MMNFSYGHVIFRTNIFTHFAYKSYGFFQTFCCFPIQKKDYFGLVQDQEITQFCCLWPFTKIFSIWFRTLNRTKTMQNIYNLFILCFLNYMFWNLVLSCHHQFEQMCNRWKNKYKYEFQFFLSNSHFLRVEMSTICLQLILSYNLPSSFLLRISHHTLIIPNVL